MARQETAATIINRVAIEVGLKPVADPFATADEAFTQLTGLLNAAGAELVEVHDWPTLQKPFTFTTATADADGLYALPDDYDRIVNQTGWDLSNDVPVLGPLSPQDWAMLQGRDLASDSIYVGYRIYQDQVQVYPTPPPEGSNVSFSYISRNWARNAGGTGIDFVTAAGDVILFDPLLMQKFLKLKFLLAKSLPTAAAAGVEFENVLQNRVGNANSAKVLSAGNSSPAFPLLNGFFNTPDTGYGG
jgi:hypothetical protein